MNRFFLALIVGVCVLAGCKPSVPSDIIQPDDMEDLLVDYHLAKAMAQLDDREPEKYDYNQQLYLDAALHKHGVTRAEFDSSLVYYYTHAEDFFKIYTRVGDRLDKQAVALGASEGEIGRFSAFSANGDTANVWQGRAQTLLLPMPPRNLMEFELEVDSSFHQGDKFLLQYVSDFVFQAGSKDAVALLSITYEGDTVVTRTTHFSSAGITQLRHDGLSGRAIRRIRGFFYLGGGNEPSTTLRLLFINNIQLIRFHQKDVSVQPTPTQMSSDSLQSADRRVGADLDSASHRDTVRSGNPVLPAQSGRSFHRVVEGGNHP